ncbi:aldehyde dehydrogenase [Candidatus Poribacteria bacterium]|jgi:acyl-CoA reductase-like NAD-dependent aldehyde dehydrogenase|nr:aldehyde dehydrogenase [Candidatus Poribacteria bacterium]MBT5532466.1 aldehyde dehydrogenase [Candidatus Poribacteria bacterium]MBT5709762.1 aldehyde dehydrogenase [Candidatus Poribacteria bacterium]MBT7804151.1 aldehyde dehydrogenase [Candidatus Poribacteria bacterium]
MTHVPVLRKGKPYRSLNAYTMPHVETGEPVAEVSLANRGLIARDLADASANKRALEQLRVRDIIAMCGRAARAFREDVLPLGDQPQSPEQYVRQLSSTTGMPEALCRANMAKICLVLDEMEAVLGGLTRGLDLDIIEAGWGEQGGRKLSYVAQADALGAVLPSNSPGVHSLWLPALPLRIPLVLKPGSGEPWTPFRIAQAFMSVGCPEEAFGFYPSDYSGATEILLRCNRTMLFGGASTVKPWEGDPGVQIHGPGWSKVILGDDCADQWEDYLDVMVESVSANGGRSCINASGVWTPRHGRDIAEALADKLGAIQARPLSDPDAKIAAFANPKVAQGISDMIDGQLAVDGAEDVTQRVRRDRMIESNRCAFLNPTVVWCEDPAHPLASTELLFPFVSVVEVPQAELLERIGPTLVGTAITEDDVFVRELMASAHVERLNLGPIPTNRISWDQPHEGNLFEHLYRQRALQATA